MSQTARVVVEAYNKYNVAIPTESFSIPYDGYKSTNAYKRLHGPLNKITTRTDIDYYVILRVTPTTRVVLEVIRK